MSAQSDEGTEWTSMSIRRGTYRRVKSLKSGGETFDDLLNRLADEESA
jgi:predicted CopG family antitoxin